MGETTPRSDGSPPPRRSRWRRWMIRLGALGILAIVFLSIASLLVWRKRTVLLNRVLADALAPWRVEAGDVDIDFGGRVLELRDVRLRRAAGEPEWGRVDRLRLASSFESVRRGRVDRVEIDGAQLTITDAVAAQFNEASRPRPESAPGGPVQALGEVQIRDASVRIAVAGFPMVDAAFDFSGRDVDWSGPLTLGRQRLDIERFEAAANDGGRAALNDATITFSLAHAPGRLVIHEWSAARTTAHVTPGLIGATPPESGPALTAPKPHTDLPAITVEEVAIEAFDFRLSRFAGLPVVASSGSWHGGRIEWSGVLTAGDQSVRLREASLATPEATPDSTPLLRLPQAEIRLSVPTANAFAVESLAVTRAEVAVTPEAVHWLAAGHQTPPRPPTPTVPPSAGAAVSLSAKIRSAAIEDARFSVRGLADASSLPMALPDADWKLDAALSELNIPGPGQWSSANSQRITLREAQASFPGETPFVQFPSAVIEVVPDDYLARREVKSFVWTQPEVTLSGPLFDHFSAPPADEPAPPSPAPGTDPPRPSWFGIHARDGRVIGGRMIVRDFGPGFPILEGSVDISTDPDTGVYRALVADVTATAPAVGSPLGTFARLPIAIVTAHPTRLWEARIDSVALDGADVEIGEAAQSLAPDSKPAAPGESAAVEIPIDPATPAVPAEAKPAEPATTWRIGSLSVQRSRISVAKVVPLLDPVSFDLDWSADDVPLTAAGLEKNSIPQRLELNAISLNAAHPTGPVPVASFATVFIEFTLGGLLAQRIDRVELVSPVIYVGEQLFWYIEYYRRDKGGGESDAPSPVAAPAPGNPATPSPADPPGPSGWSVGRIDAHFGKLVLALKGNVIDALPPLPFSCSTELDKGTVDLQLEFPRGTYRPSTRVPLELDIEEGSAAFNLPFRDRSNNLVQVFRVSELRYGRGKPFIARNAFMTVTYDKNGVYGKLGGELYGGYVSGGFDIYLDDNTSWDLWTAGDSITLKPVTDTLTPAYLQMTGLLEFKMAAFGDLSSLYTASGTLRSRRPGTMTVTGLDSLRENFPETWTPLQTSLAAGGVNALREFPFETCSGRFELFGREGNLAIDLRGPDGTRSVEIEVHDHQAGQPVDPASRPR